MRGNTLTIQQEVSFHVEECCSCGVMFAMTEAHYKAVYAKKERGEFFCPNGHGQYYVGKSDAQKARDADQARREADMRYEAERDQRQAAERELRRHKQRAKGGACPCCKRSFVQLARHMKSQHPDYDPAA